MVFVVGHVVAVPGQGLQLILVDLVQAADCAHEQHIPDIINYEVFPILLFCAVCDDLACGRIKYPR